MDERNRVSSQLASIMESITPSSDTEHDWIEQGVREGKIRSETASQLFHMLEEISAIEHYIPVFPTKQPAGSLQVFL